MLTLTAAMSLFTPATRASQAPSPSVDLVEIAVVVTDRNHRPVTDLRREDFEVKDDGEVVDIKTFLAASASGSTAVDDGRSMVVLLDDVTMGPAATDSVKTIAGYLVTRGGPGDEISVIRFNNRSDEPYGDFRAALERIGEYQGAVAPFDPLRSAEDMLRRVAAVSQSLEAYGRRRKAIVCIGSRRICNIEEPVSAAPGSLRRDWIAALGAAARANVSLYALVSARGRLPAGGLAEATGGEMFASRSDLTPFIDRIWQGLSHHYLLGYWPSASSRPLHSISVKVNRKDVRVVARKRRGN
jgi:VWFA-related protein